MKQHFIQLQHPKKARRLERWLYQEIVWMKRWKEYSIAAPGFWTTDFHNIASNVTHEAVQ